MSTKFEFNTIPKNIQFAKRNIKLTGDLTTMPSGS